MSLTTWVGGANEEQGQKAFKAWRGHRTSDLRRRCCAQQKVISCRCLHEHIRKDCESSKM